ncbi:hypothetical protein Tco_1187892 [Tanacetum coccineum]
MLSRSNVAELLKHVTNNYYIIIKDIGPLGKWKLRFLTEDKALWNIVIKEFYGAGGSFNSTVNHNGVGRIWHDIISAIKDIDHIDAAFLRLYALEIHKDCNINDRWTLANDEWGWSWSWRILPRGRPNNDLESLASCVGSLNLSVEGRDVWKWSLDNSGFGSLCYQVSYRPSHLAKSLELVGYGATSGVPVLHYCNTPKLDHSGIMSGSVTS